MMRKQILKRGVSAILAGMLCVSILCPGNAAKAEKKEFDPNGVYHAALGLQTCTQVWINRFAYFDKEANQYYGTEDANKMFAADPSGGGASYAGNFEDVEIKGNGTYTVKLTDADFGGETDISQLHVATDIPLNDKIKFTDVSFAINDKKIATFEEGYMEDEEPYLGGGMDLLLINHWRDGLVEQLKSKGVYETVDSGCTLLQGTTGESISVTFTISGFDYDNPDAVAEEEASEAPKAEKKDTAKKEESKQMNPVPICIGAGVVLVVIAGVVIVRRKKK